MYCASVIPIRSVPTRRNLEQGYPFNIRWTERLAKLLGPEWRVIEEGMGGRTQVFDNPLEPHRSGLEALPIILQSHRPLDYAVIMPGTNDLKEIFNASPRTIAAGAEMVARAIWDGRYASPADGTFATLIYANWFGKILASSYPMSAGKWRVSLPPSFDSPDDVCTAEIGGSIRTVSSRTSPKRQRAALQFRRCHRTVGIHVAGMCALPGGHCGIEHAQSN